jgi:hypothetical protein
MSTSTMTPLSLVEQLNGLHVGVALWSTSDVRILEDNNDLATAAASSWPITERLRPPQGGSPARLAPTLRSSECDHLGPPRRARPRLVRVRLADNLRGAPGGPADPNGASGSLFPGDRWINGLPRGSTPARRGRRESRSRGGVSRLPCSRQGVTHASGRNSPGVIHSVLTVVKRKRRASGVEDGAMATPTRPLTRMVRAAPSSQH